MRPCKVLDHYKREYLCEAIGRRAMMAPENALEAADKGLVEILSPIGVQAYLDRQKQAPKQKRTYNRRDVQAKPSN
jgi:hypothetical protein